MPSGLISRLVSLARGVPMPCWETNHDVGRTVFLAGSGRSGTTWVSEILNARRDFRYINEPFNCRKTAEWGGYDFQQYFPRAHADKAAAAAARCILSGRARSPWMDRQNRTLVASRRLVKDIRCNLMLGWLRAQFPQMPILWLVRHPLSVIASRRRLGWGPQMDFETLRAVPGLVADHLEPHMSFIESCRRDDFSMQLVNWCVEHLVPARQLEPGEYHLVRYEDLSARPEATVEGMLRYAGIDAHADHFAQLARPSASASKPRRLGKSPTDAPADSRGLCDEALERFGLLALVSPTGGALGEGDTPGQCGGGAM